MILFKCQFSAWIKYYFNKITHCIWKSNGIIYPQMKTWLGWNGDTLEIVQVNKIWSIWDPNEVQTLRWLPKKKKEKENLLFRLTIILKKETNTWTLQENSEICNVRMTMFPVVIVAHAVVTKQLKRRLGWLETGG